MTAKRKDTRGHSHELEIEASPEAVWKAITDPEELSKWFPISAEATLGPFLADLENGCAKRMYRADKFPEVTETPVPAWELADLGRYASMSIQFSRGCPYDCEFCDVTVLFGHRPRTKTPAQIRAELGALWDRGWRGRIFFVDDNLIGNRRKVREDLLPTLLEWRKEHPSNAFFTETTINLVDDPKLMELMVEAGFDTVFVGIETPAEASLIECSKKQNTRAISSRT